jgi:dihydroorotate dehydrogenase
MTCYRWLKPLLYGLPAEYAHHIAIAALRLHLVPKQGAILLPRLSTTLWKKTFTSPIGLAAGFDKDGIALSGLSEQGFGFIEAGTVTLRPQPGNPPPRLYRLTEDEAIINRMGFNNKGSTAMLRRLYDFQHRPCIIGVNIGINKDCKNPFSDYARLIRMFAPVADYITINISSPNTAGLRELQQPDSFLQLLQVAKEQLNDLPVAIRCPVLVKISPDLTPPELEKIVIQAVEMKIDGLIISNTTIDEREHLRSMHAHEKGGLSGKPLMERSTGVLKTAYALSKGKIPLIGVGGITSGADAYRKIRAGASLVQLYSALIFRGFALIPLIHQELDALLEQDGFSHISEAVGIDAHENIDKKPRAKQPKIKS